MLSAVLHLVRTDQAKATAVQKAAKTAIDTAVQSEELGGNNAKKSKYNIGAITNASSEVGGAPANHCDDLVYYPRIKGLRNAVYNDQEEHLRRVREASNKYLASCNLGQE